MEELQEIINVRSFGVPSSLQIEIVLGRQQGWTTWTFENKTG